MITSEISHADWECLANEVIRFLFLFCTICVFVLLFLRLSITFSISFLFVIWILFFLRTKTPGLVFIQCLQSDQWDKGWLTWDYISSKSNILPRMALAFWQFPPRVGCFQRCSQVFLLAAARASILSATLTLGNGLEWMQPFRRKKQNTWIIYFFACKNVACMSPPMYLWHGFLLVEYPSAFLLCSRCPLGGSLTHTGP